jgi:hypothetical protein
VCAGLGVEEKIVLKLIGGRMNSVFKRIYLGGTFLIWNFSAGVWLSGIKEPVCYLMLCIGM